MAEVWSWPRREIARTLEQVKKTFRCGCLLFEHEGALIFHRCADHNRLDTGEFALRVLIWDGELGEQDQDQTPREWP